MPIEFDKTAARLRDESGAVALIFALCAVVFFGFLAVSIDLSRIYFGQKSLQANADLAATSAVRKLDQTGSASSQSAARLAAERTTTGNGLTSDAVTRVDFGYYQRDKSIPIDQRLRATPAQQGQNLNATTVVLREDLPLYFASMFLPEKNLNLSASATATRADYAAFTLGSRLLQLHDDSVLNGILNAALGTKINLKLLDYNALLDTRINLLDFLDLLGNRLDLQVMDYNDILNANIDLLDLVGVLLEQTPVAETTDVLAQVLSGTTKYTLNIRQLIAIKGDQADLNINDILPKIDLSVFDILMASVDIVNAANHNLIKLPLSLKLPGITSADLMLVVGEQQAGSGWVTIGSSGATIHTAQVRLKLDLRLGDILSGTGGNFDPNSVNSGLGNNGTVTGSGFRILPLEAYLPIYIEVASGTVTLGALNCNAPTDKDWIARFETGGKPFKINPDDWSSAKKYFNRFVGTGLDTSVNNAAIAAVYLGYFEDDIFKNLTKPLSPKDLQPGTLLNLQLKVGSWSHDIIAIHLRTALFVGASRDQSVTFKKDEIGTTKTVRSGLILSGLVSQLLNPKTIEISVVPGKASLVGGILALLINLISDLKNQLFVLLPGDILSALLVPVDLLLDWILELLGLGVGEMDLTLQGVSCGDITLVQ